jgi:hypothetical protein
MGGAGGMTKRLGVADIGQMADHPQAFDELLAGGPAALDSEALMIEPAPAGRRFASR